MLKNLVGDRAFYRRVYALVLPVMIQNMVTSFVSMLDSIMVGQVGTDAMSAVSIANQLIMVFNVLVFGANAGAGIFASQFVGAQDHDGVRYTFRFKMYISAAISLVAVALFVFCGDVLANLYLQGEGDPAVAQNTLRLAVEYLAIMAIGLFPFAVTSAYASTLRETGKTVIPMVGSVCAVLTNLVGNYILIFGHFGAPAMGVAGAAVATVGSRFVEFLILVGWTHWNTEKNPFIRGVYRSVYIPKTLLKRITVKGLPLLFNEVMFSSSMAIINQSYTTCGLDVLPAMNIVSTIQSLATVGYAGLGNAAGIILGQEIGSGKEKEAVIGTNRKLLALAAVLAGGCGLLMVGLSGVFPLMYNTTQEVRTLATVLIVIEAASMPFNAYNVVTYFCIRSGGKVFTTALFDSGTIWVFGVISVYLLSRLTNIGIIPLFCVGHLMHLCKAVFGTYLLRKGDWVRNLIKY